MKTEEEISETPVRTYWFNIDNQWTPSLEDMVAKLLDEQVLFVGWDQNFLETITLYVNCSDVFAWGGADAEPVKSSELPELFEMHDDDPIYGSTKWVCKKRNMQPQFPLIEKMKEYDKWDAKMEMLPKNRFNEKYENM